MDATNNVPAPLALRPLAVFVALALCLSLSSCQCSWKPDVGPVEEDEEARLAAPVPPRVAAEATPRVEATLPVAAVRVAALR